MKKLTIYERIFKEDLFSAEDLASALYFINKKAKKYRDNRADIKNYLFNYEENEYSLYILGKMIVKKGYGEDIISIEDAKEFAKIYEDLFFGLYDITGEEVYNMGLDEKVDEDTFERIYKIIDSTPYVFDSFITIPKSKTEEFLKKLEDTDGVLSGVLEVTETFGYFLMEYLKEGSEHFTEPEYFTEIVTDYEILHDELKELRTSSNSLYSLKDRVIKKLKLKPVNYHFFENGDIRPYYKLGGFGFHGVALDYDEIVDLEKRGIINYGDIEEIEGEISSEVSRIDTTITEEEAENILKGFLEGNHQLK